MIKRVNPEFLAGLESFTDFDFKVEHLAAMREGMAQAVLSLTSTETVNIINKTITGIDDNEIRVRIYKPNFTKIKNYRFYCGFMAGLYIRFHRRQ